MVDGELTNRNVLISGGAGFIGSHLADALVEDNDVTVLDDLSHGQRAHVPDEATFVQGDVNDETVLDEAMRDTDVVFHQAAQVSVDRSVDAPQRSHATNVDATLSLLERARDHDVRVVLASSCAVYGHPESLPIPESAPLDPTSPYGLEKLTVDHYARLYNDLYDLETVALRYFNVYGPRQAGGDYSGVISIFLDQAADDEPLTVHGEGTQTRDFIHVSDVVRANLLAATTDAVGEAFNVGTGRETSVIELAETIREVMDAESDIVHTDPRAGDIERSCADTSKAAAGLGFEATTALDEGIETLVSSR
jgi:UDP-glucose 4-epimerase